MSATAGRPVGAADRVPRSQAQLRSTLRLVLATVAVAAAVGATAIVRDWPDPTWAPLHLFLAGAVVLAISGTSLMLTVTWSAAPAPPDRAVALQRCAVLLGALGVVVGRSTGAQPLVAVGGAAHLAGLLGLAILLLVTVRRGVERRFDVAVASYLSAVAAGTAGVGIGVAMAIDGPTVGLRSAHLALNLLGLVGLVVGGTMPFFAATVGRSKMHPGATSRVLGAILGWQVGALVVTVAAAASDGPDLVVALGLGGYALGIVATLARLPRPTRRQLTWAGPRIVGVWAGGCWWVVAVAAAAAEAAAGRAVLPNRWILVVVLAFAQVLWGSLAYLLPMLRGGGPEVLGQGFAATRSWLGLVAVNLATIALAVAGSQPVALVAIAVWVLDGAVRAARVGTTRASRPTR